MWRKIKNRIRSWRRPPKLERRAIACPICRSTSRQFFPLDDWFINEIARHQFLHGLDKFETLELDYYSCPHCFSSDRCRLMALYLQKRLTGKTPLKVLDIAPSQALGGWLKNRSDIIYRSCDLFMEEVDDRVDITDMAIYGDNAFDLYICSHVLEHVADEKRALSELYRILKPGGFGLNLVPISLMIDETREDPSITSPAARWQHYAQNDHVRLYSKQGFVKSLQSPGFSVSTVNVTDFPDYAFHRHGIDGKSVLYVTEK